MKTIKQKMTITEIIQIEEELQKKYNDVIIDFSFENDLIMLEGRDLISYIIMNDLSTTERDWYISLYAYKFNISKLSRITKLNRITITKRYKEITEKIKQKYREYDLY